MPPLLDNAVLAATAEDTQALGRAIAARLGPGDCLALVGELGAGKTTFVQGLAEGLGVSKRASSPSYLIVQEYPGPVPLFHVDAYRLSNAEELVEIGFEEYLTAGGVVAVEWADRVAAALPPGAHWLKFELVEGQARRIESVV